MTSKAIGFTGATVPCFLSSFSSCSLDFFFAFLPPASPPPVGMCLPSMDRVRKQIEHSSGARLPRLTRMPDAKRQARVTTKTGDAGDTSLFGPGRNPKNDPSSQAHRALEEAQSA